MKIKNILPYILLVSTAAKAQNAPASFTGDIQPAVFSLTMVMLHDVVSPPAASRYYAYSMIGAYEIVSRSNSSMVKGSAFIKRFPSFVISLDNKSYDYRIAAVYCILETGKLMLPSGSRLQEREDKWFDSLRRKGYSEKILKQSIAVAAEVANHVVAWSKLDNYNRLSAQIRYTPLKGDAYWYPTPPAYMEAVEPHWRIIKPFVIDTCNQFKPLPPVAFSKDSGSKFYIMAREVYDVSKKPLEEQENIAAFWDCNPFAVSSSGHMMIGFKKITPGGHWMNIAAIAARKSNLDFDHTIMVHLVVAITQSDAFVSCWDEKYRSNRIRPETYINRYIDLEWKPLLQTPPFPEYTSGHSVVSTASAEVLSFLFGDRLGFTDDSEILFGIPPRQFRSFRQASEEAAISRLYGGIHYRDAIENGQTEGKKLGEFVVSRLKAAGMTPVPLARTASK
ncbi:MAG: haloperoxidase [Bacteroidetes bacterium]|nr:MAG: haloperoxidase [Bacteroidota bacterium]